MAVQHLNFKILLLFMSCFETKTNNFFLEVRGKGGFILSPNYPNLYPKNVSVIWTLIAGSQYFIELNFISFDLEKVKDCRYDYVQVRNSLTDSWLAKQKYCNYEKPGVLQFNGSWVQVKLISDSDREATGFNLTWTAYKSGRSSTLPIKQPTAASTLNAVSPTSVKKSQTVIPIVKTVTISSCIPTSRSQTTSKYSQLLHTPSSSMMCPCPSTSDSTRMQSTKILVIHPSSDVVQWTSTVGISYSRSSNINQETKSETYLYSIGQGLSNTAVLLSERMSSSSSQKCLFTNKETEKASSEPSTLAVVFSILTALFALISFLLAILLCSKSRANRIHVVGLAAKNKAMIKVEKDFVLEGVKCHPSLIAERYSTFESPGMGKKVQLTAQTSIASSYAGDEKTQDEKGSIHISNGCADDGNNCQPSNISQQEQLSNV